MALGGGTFTSQNKILPGSYINVISKAQPAAILGERGIVALPMALSWGTPGEVITVTAEKFQRYSLEMFGYPYTADEMKPLREVFKRAQKVHVYNLADGEDSTKATITHTERVLFEAKHAGSRGNKLKLVYRSNLDDSDAFNLALYLDGSLVFESEDVGRKGLVENDYIRLVDANFNLNDAKNIIGAGLNFSGGTDGAVSNTSYQNALNKFESYYFNVLVCPDSATVGDLYIEYTKRLRDAVGVKFQTVVVEKAADYEGVVNLLPAQADAIYWVAGALAGCAVNKSCTNMKYDGEVTIPCNETQFELEECILSGKFVFHKVEDEVRVLTDINSLVTYTENKGDMFSKNQVVRVADQCANDTAKMFNNEFLGKVQNDKSGRISFWNRIVTHRRELETMRAIDKYDVDSLIVEQGNKRDSVVVSEIVVPIAAMEKLYMTIVIN